MGVWPRTPSIWQDGESSALRAEAHVGKSSSLLFPDREVDLTWILSSNLNARTTKFIGENTEGFLCDPGLGNVS